ncbi:MAG: hypothetical protein ACK54L_08780, partial [Betaproteobacteria bacterium]
MEIKAINSQIAQALGALRAPAATPGTRGPEGADFVASLDAALRSVSANQPASAGRQRQVQRET